jgi:hypothetical protein
MITTVQMPIDTVRARIGDHIALVGVWAAVVSASLVYWEACRLAHGAVTINLRDSSLWMVEIWSGWLVMSFPAYECCRRWRASPAGISLHRVLGLMVALSVLALACEWLLNVALAQRGAIERWDSAWTMFNRRALLCVIVSAAIILFAARPSLVWRKLGGADSSNAPEAPNRGDDATLVLTSREGPITVPLRDVEAILAAENYVQICMISGKQHLHRAALAAIERELDPGRMLRVHRSALVNVERVAGRLAGWRLQLTSGRVVRVSRSFRKACDDALRSTK